MKKKLALLFLGVLFTVGCSKNEKFIQGTWYTRSDHQNEVSGETYLESTWVFNNGSFEYHTCCFCDDHHIKGRYRVVKNEDDVITLELFNVQGTLTEMNEIRVEIDREADTLTIGGGYPFRRVLKSE